MANDDIRIKLQAGRCYLGRHGQQACIGFIGCDPYEDPNQVVAVGFMYGQSGATYWQLDGHFLDANSPHNLDLVAEDNERSYSHGKPGSADPEMTAFGLAALESARAIITAFADHRKDLRGEEVTLYMDAMRVLRSQFQMMMQVGAQEMAALAEQERKAAAEIG